MAGGRNKYGNRRTEVDGISFASAKEARRYSELKLLERAGKIKGLHLQPRFPLRVNEVTVTTYVADFIFDRDGETVVEDVKGVRTPTYKLKKKLMKAIHDIDVVEV
jgi:hypothetical protein